MAGIDPSAATRAGEVIELRFRAMASATQVILVDPSEGAAD
jgi:hypothetical protein